MAVGFHSHPTGGALIDSTDRLRSFRYALNTLMLSTCSNFQPVRFRTIIRMTLRMIPLINFGFIITRLFWLRGDRETTMWFALVFLLRGQGIRGVEIRCNCIVIIARLWHFSVKWRFSLLQRRSCAAGTLLE